MNRGGGSCGARTISTHNKFSLQQRGFTTGDNTTILPAKNLPDAFRNATLYSDSRIYKLLRFERPSMELALQVWTESTKNPLSTNVSSTSPFGCIMVDKDEITMMVDKNVYNEHFNSTKLPKSNENTIVDNGINYRLFTFDNVVMDPSLVGFMAVVTKVLAENDISVLPYAAYTTDHVFVADKDAEKTRTILEGLFR